MRGTKSLRLSDSKGLKNLDRTAVRFPGFLGAQRDSVLFYAHNKQNTSRAHTGSSRLYTGCPCIDRPNIDSIFVWPDIIVGQDESRVDRRRIPPIVPHRGLQGAEGGEGERQGRTPIFGIYNPS